MGLKMLGWGTLTGNVMTVILQVLPPALNCKQFMAYTGLSKSSFFHFAKKHKAYAVVIDGHGNQRVKREWADAFVLGRMREMAESVGVKYREDDGT